MRVIYELKKGIARPMLQSARRSTRRGKGSRYTGSTMVEFALILPLLLLLSLCVIQYGLILNATIGLSHLSREGGRFAAVSPTMDIAIKDRIRDVAPKSLNYSDLQIVITPEEGSDQRVSPKPISVAITYDMSKKLFLPRRFFGVQVFSPVFTTKASAMIESQD